MLVLGYCGQHRRKFRIWIRFQNDASRRIAENSITKINGRIGSATFVLLVLHNWIDHVIGLVTRQSLTRHVHNWCQVLLCGANEVLKIGRRK